MLEYLAYYALFAVLMTGCLLYVMSTLETMETPLPKQQDSKSLFNGDNATSSPTSSHERRPYGDHNHAHSQRK
jgi:hypothetical protein